MGMKRFDIFLEKHIGLGIRWANRHYSLELSLSVMCITLTIGLGEKKYD